MNIRDSVYIYYSSQNVSPIFCFTCKSASVISTFLASSAALYSDLAIAAKSAIKIRLFGLLVSSTKKLSTAETDDSAIIADVLLT